MAEPEDIDEDLFADLYDGEDAPPTQSASAEVDTQPEPFDPTAAPVEQPISTANPPETSATHDVPAVSFDAGSNQVNPYGAGQSYNGYENDATHGNNDQVSPDSGLIGIKEDGKMFIGGLNWETTDESLHDYFSQFGEVAECTVMRDGATGRSRGFGFLTFRDPKTVNTVMVKEHFLDGKIIDPKRAIPRDEQEKTAKIFVGGVSQEATETIFREYFMQYGRVIDATLMMDKDTGRPRGFGFVTFDSEAGVEATLQGDLTILGKPIEVKKAQPRGAVHDDEGARGFRGRGGMRRDFQDQSGGSAGAGGSMGMQGNPMAAGGMTPQAAAQYWQRMQQFMAQFMAAAQSGAMANMGMASGGMNPMMAQMKQMQAMQQMQQQMQAGNKDGSSPMQGMNPQMMQQMMAMSGMNGGQGAGQGAQNAAQGAPAGPSGRRGFQGDGFQQGGPTSWEGMYDDVPQPDMGGSGNSGGRGGYRGGYRGGRGGYGPKHDSPRPQQSQAPANAPTGPKNPGSSGPGYRGGGGRGGHRGNFHPYRR